MQDLEITSLFCHRVTACDLLPPRSLITGTTWGPRTAAGGRKSPLEVTARAALG